MAVNLFSTNRNALSSRSFEKNQEERGDKFQEKTTEKSHDNEREADLSHTDIGSKGR